MRLVRSLAQGRPEVADRGAPRLDRLGDEGYGTVERLPLGEVEHRVVQTDAVRPGALVGALERVPAAGHDDAGCGLRPAAHRDDHVDVGPRVWHEAPEEAGAGSAQGGGQPDPQQRREGLGLPVVAARCRRLDPPLDGEPAA